MKKIMFNDRFGLTEAVLTGRKTMTRRVIKETVDDPDVKIGNWRYSKDGGMAVKDVLSNDGSPSGFVSVPQYQIGEEIAVAQSYSRLSWDASFYEKLRKMCERLPQYELAGWDNKMFVRANLMPHHIHITGIKVERLQDISDEDCLKEGIEVEDFRGEYSWGFYTGFYINSRTGGQGSRSVWCNSPRKAFAALIDRISGKGTWARNPWVFAYEFELVKKLQQ